MTRESVWITVLGGGEIGLGMAAVFADAGASVEVVDPDGSVRASAQDKLQAYSTEMQVAGLLQDRSGGEVVLREALADTRKQAALVVEAGPEDLSIKRQLFSEIRAHVGDDVPIVTTSSAITISQILEDPGDRRAALVAHPANPPTLIRIVECVPAPETDLAVVETVTDLLNWAGFSAVRIGHEVEGFALNRLQSALLREAYRLVEAGVVDVNGADRLVSEGLGLRWALSGPFETADLNTAGGIAAHVQRMGPAYTRIGMDNGERGLPWSEQLVASVIAQRNAALPAERRNTRVEWRRRALAALIAHKHEVINANGARRAGDD
ncbi:MAG: 3-hydroxyacyl-CoA dehydrogenase [Hyphomicrobiales bacterium]|nr:3-hydroxyacyl-CoA dehydrogenase [Hyphomicrobiales bacterium]MCP4998764.1 3-hydroxyacyl-CoA dehydrogenase [Hyphomicrobiales bacterium]